MADLEARVQALEAKVQELRDRNEIQELRFGYHIAVNEKKPEMIPDLFAENSEIDFAHLGKAQGKTNVAAFYRQALSDLVPFVKQFIHNHVITLTGNTGTGLSYLEAKPIFNGESFLVAARFDDEYVRENGRWKFRKMTLIPYFMVPLREGWAGENKIQMVRK
ncbi:MAG: nuclear transport factor 2 family protein [Deltaproteobacteria bacterium]|nr:nuclear transport factor 2 family protein [Deltaproteobacteria bacterium]